MTLKELKKGKTASILSVGGEGALRQHFLDMGLIPGAEVTMVKLAPMGDPMELRIHGYELTLRLADAEQIEIRLRHLIRRQKKQRKQREKPYRHHILVWVKEENTIGKKMNIRFRKQKN